MQPIIWIGPQSKRGAARGTFVNDERGRAGAVAHARREAGMTSREQLGLDPALPVALDPKNLRDKATVAVTPREAFQQDGLVAQ